MKTRIISSLIMLPFLALLWLGGIPLFAACLVISAIGMHEFYKGLEAMGHEPCVITGYTGLAILYTIVFLESFTSFEPSCGWAAVRGAWLFIVLFMCFGVSLTRKDHGVFDGPLGALGVLYIGFFCNHVVLTERLDHNMVWLIFLTAFGTDIMAYFTGYFLGKHKLCPELSPKKTVEGAIGGVLGSALFCLVFALIAAPQKTLQLVLLGIFASPFAQAGDLIASAFKRKMGIKDYGKLIPGHGGIMDRFDSVLITAPFVYYFLLIAA